MKTLTESIINELRLSKAVTGNKLDRKTFGELKPGENIYYYDPNVDSFNTITDVIYPVEKVEETKIQRFIHGYTEDNPDKTKYVKLTKKITITKKGEEIDIYAPADESWVVLTDKKYGEIDSILALESEVFNNLFKKYKR